MQLLCCTTEHAAGVSLLSTLPTLCCTPSQVDACWAHQFTLVRLLHVSLCCRRLAAIGELKMLVGVSKDRLAGLSVSPAAGLPRHARTLGLLLLLQGMNGLCLALLWRQQRELSRAICLLLGLDLAVIAVDAAKATVR